MGKVIYDISMSRDGFISGANARLEAVWDKVNRLRRGVQAIYGDDSSQYGVVGGTPDGRKPASRSVRQAV